MNDLINSDESGDADRGETNGNGISHINDRISPSAVYPAELQGISPTEDLWRRIRKHANGATYTKKRLTEEPELSLAITVTMNAALEREDDIKRHNQSRVFSEILGRVLDGFRSFLGTSLAPKQWQQSRTVLIASSAAPQTAIQSDDPAEESDEGATPSLASEETKIIGPALWQKVLAGILTPKIFLGVAAAILALATGYSQLQILNYKKSIASFESAAESAERKEKNLESLMSTLNSQLQERETKVATSERARLDAQASLLEEAKKLSQSSTNLKTANDKIKELELKLKAQRGSVAEEVAKAEKAQRDAEAKLTATLKEVGNLKTEAAVFAEQRKTLTADFQKLNDDYKLSQKQVNLQVAAVRAAQAEKRRFENDARLLLLAEQAIDASYSALPTWRNDNEQAVYSAINKYRSDKRILQRE